jgi:RNA polymerase sigma-70 factor, ECF subfamily
MTDHNDQYYINLIINGDINTFSVLVKRYKDLVFTLALRMLKNRDEAEEASQDTFIKVYKSLSKFKGDSKFSTWIYKVAYNNCLDRLKQNKKKYQHVSIDDFTGIQIASMETALDAMEQEEYQSKIQRCLQLLPSQDAFLLTLYYFEEHSLEDISKIVGLTANNVKVKIFRSRKKLAKILKERLEPEIIEQYER